MGKVWDIKQVDYLEILDTTKLKSFNYIFTLFPLCDFIKTFYINYFDLNQF